MKIVGEDRPKKEQNLLFRLFSTIGALFGLINNNFKALLILLLLFLLFGQDSNQTKEHYNLTTIKLEGPIIDVTQTIERIEAAKEDEAIKGVLFKINSPGGAVAPSLEIAYAIKELADKKPVVVYASGMLTSGGYYSAIWANHIIANPGSIVGSIGVIIEGADLSELLNKIGIKTQSVQKGKYKKVGTPDRAWLPYEKAELERLIQNTYDMFTSDVAKARKLDLATKDRWADAHIFTAKEAKSLGLVDEVATISHAKSKLVELSGVKEARWSKEDTFERLFANLFAQAAMMLNSYLPPLSLR